MAAVILIGHYRRVGLFGLIWLIAGIVTWLGVLGFSDFALWNDHWVAVVIGMIVSAAFCVFFWPAVALGAVAGIGR